MDVLTEVSWLFRQLDDSSPQAAAPHDPGLGPRNHDGHLVLLDVRWSLGDPHGRARYREGHLPGAVYVDLDTELAAPPSRADGRHPLPDIADLQAAARWWGLRHNSAVVVYDDTAGLAAARAWWLLRWAGLAQVSMLNGGLGAWRAAGQRLVTGDARPPPGDVVLTAGQLPVIGPDEAARLANDSGSVLLDARATERYQGAIEPVDARAGHIPGAVSAPTVENLDAAGRLLPAPSLRARFADLGVRPGALTAVYCGSGVTAAHQVAALASIGVDAALYPGSWSQWSADPERAVAVGSNP